MSGHRDPHESGPPGRTEPTLGDLDQLDSPRARSPRDGLPAIAVEPRRRAAEPARPRRPRRRGWLIPLLALVLLALLVLLWLNQGRLRALLPRTGFDDVLHRAQVALQEGRLDGNDGTSARELFEAARALEPDNDRALDGLHQVGEAEVARADAALKAGQLDQAEQALTAARELLGGGSEVDRLGQAIARARGANGQTATLIDRARQAFAAGKLDGADGAGELYKRALAVDAGNAVARHGLDQVGAALAAQAHKALAEGDRAAVDDRIGHLAALLPNYAELPSLRAAQTQLQQQAGAALAAALQQGQDALRAGHISGEGDDTALAHFRAALAIDPDNTQARAGLGQVAAALIVQANAAIDVGDTAQAGQLLDQAAALAPRSADLLAARSRLGAPASSPPAASGGSEDAAPAPPVPSPEQQARIDALVKRAQAATAQGRIMSPPGDCAYDLYRSALAIDGNDAAARAGLHALPGIVTQQFEQALAGGNLGRAGNLLDVLDNLSPGDASLVPLRQRLAGAWLDQAERQLDGGNRGGAAQSLQQARKLAPNHPRVQELGARLQGGA
jgi:tetratricopeptide (TPR) repeat protein